MVWEILTLIGAWIALVFICANVLGFVLKPSESAEGTSIVPAFSMGGVILVGVFLGLLVYFGNVFLASAAAMLMVGRLPDLAFEIRHQRQVELPDMRKTAFPIISTLLMWGSLPVVWFGLYGSSM